MAATSGSSTRAHGSPQASHRAPRAAESLWNAGTRRGRAGVARSATKPRAAAKPVRETPWPTWAVYFCQGGETGRSPCVDPKRSRHTLRSDPSHLPKPACSADSASTLRWLSEGILQIESSAWEARTRRAKRDRMVRTDGPLGWFPDVT